MKEKVIQKNGDGTYTIKDWLMVIIFLLTIVGTVFGFYGKVRDRLVKIDDIYEIRMPAVEQKQELFEKEVIDRLARIETLLSQK